MTTPLAQTPLHAWHVEHGGRMVDFAGWSMPVQYGSIVAEHQATRTSMGLFDVSHMGRFRFEGPGAAAFLDRLTTRRVRNLKPGKIRYSLVTNDQGGILDDVLVYHLLDSRQQPFHFLVVNASNREKIAGWLGQHQDRGDECSLEDCTLHTAMIAVQGPRALEIAQHFLQTPLAELSNYSGRVVVVDGQDWIISRTGYTGEDGVELIVPADAAPGLWAAMLAKGAPRGARAAGLGARDTLRLEAAMPLYGHELSEQINPFQAGLDFAVNLKDRDFPGRDALLKLRDDPSLSRRVGLELSGKRAARPHYAILARGQTVGEVTSGTFSPTLQRPIAMGYVPLPDAREGQQLSVDVRGKQAAARVVSMPFYTRN